MSNELMVALAGLVLSVLTYFAGVVRTEKRLNKRDAQERIDFVLEKYLKLCQTRQDSGWSAALRSGFSTLSSDAEIRAVSLLIVQHGESYPLNSEIKLENVDLKVLFDYVAKNKLNFNFTPIEKLIEDANA